MIRGIRLACALVLAVTTAAWGADAPGVTPTEIKIGGIFPFSGPASSIGLVGRGVLAYVQSINDRGGIGGRKINYIAFDDAYSPPKAFEHARRLVESDDVAFLFSYDTEGKIYAKYLTRTLPAAKYAILYQNDDLGRDYVNAFKSSLGPEFERRVVTAAYEVTEPTIDSQVVSLKSSGAAALLVAGTPKFAAQAIRKAAEIGWKPTLMINFPSSSVAGTLKPAGLENSIGVIVGTPNKDPNDPRWSEDAAVKAYRAFFEKYLSGADITNTSYLTGYQQGMVLEQILKQCGDDLSRANIIKQAKSLRDFLLPTALPGVKINTSASNNMVWTQLQLQRWNGTSWDQFGEILDATSE